MMKNVTGNVEKLLLEKAHQACLNNVKLIKKSHKCGCFYCLSIYDAGNVKQWIDEGTTGMLPTAFDFQPVAKAERIHQSEMPVGLWEAVLKFITKVGETVLDTFAGSGVVGEACLKLKRNCILIEILHENVEKIKRRLGKCTFQDALWEG